MKPDWQPIETYPEHPLGYPHQVLVTNNPTATDAHGQMSHVWIADPIESPDGEFVAFDAADEMIRGLTHWRPLPDPPEAPDNGEEDT